MKPRGLPKTGGRKPGTPNKRTVEVQERLAALGCDPIEAMAKAVVLDAVALCVEGGYLTAAEAKDNPGLARAMAIKLYPPELTLRMAAELAQYVAPKRKAIEHTGRGGEALKLEVVLNG